MGDKGDKGTRGQGGQGDKGDKEELPITNFQFPISNFPPRQIAEFMSEVMISGVMLDNDEVVLIKPDNQGKRI